MAVTSNAAAIARLDLRLYPNAGSNWDDTAFRTAVLALLQPHMTALDLGAGSGHVVQMNFRGMAARICGVDPDPRVLENPHLDEGRVGFAESIPYPDSTFDLVFSDNVLEHLEVPEIAFQEIRRVLKPGGLFLAKTPNRWHYVTLLARMTPTGVHKFCNRLRGRPEQETFRTFYRANSPRQIQKLAAAAGLKVNSITMMEGRPEYLRFSPLTYIVGWAYERIVNKIAALEPFRVVLIASMMKS
jgi:SAM-dependent methyltransferase